MLKEVDGKPSSVTRGHGLLEGFLAKQRCKMANRLIPPHLRSRRLLDIGCGSYPFFLMNTPFHQKFGLDKVAGAEQVARFQKDGVTLISHDVEDGSPLPFEDDSVAVVTMLAVFEHIKPVPLVQLLKEVHRVLEPDGLFIMTTPASWSDRLLKLMARVSLVSAEEIDEHQDAYTVAKIAAILEQAGFGGKQIRLGYFECFLNIWATAGTSELRSQAGAQA